MTAKEPKTVVVKIYTVAVVPQELAQNWLKHLREFDTAHPGCRFQVFADGKDMNDAAAVDGLRLELLRLPA